MTAQNEEAEELMRKMEKEEDKLIYEDPNKKVFHLCIVNLVIGYPIYLYYKNNINFFFNFLLFDVILFLRTLYCAKGNYDFGISRIIRSLEPYNKKLGTDTW